MFHPSTNSGKSAWYFLCNQANRRTNQQWMKQNHLGGDKRNLTPSAKLNYFFLAVSHCGPSGKHTIWIQDHKFANSKNPLELPLNKSTHAYYPHIHLKGINGQFFFPVKSLRQLCECEQGFPKKTESLCETTPDQLMKTVWICRFQRRWTHLYSIASFTIRNELWVTSDGLVKHVDFLALWSCDVRWLLIGW